MKTQSPRCTRRVPLAVRIRIIGSDVDGRAYMEDAQTIDVGRDGALILTERNLTPQEELTIRVETTGAESPAQIIGRVRQHAGGSVYGLKLLDPGVKLWPVAFLPPDEEQALGADTLLECSKCLVREVIPLGEFEAEVYRTNRYLYHPCARCREATIWNEASYAPSERMREIPAPPPAPPAPPAPALRIGNSRRHNRVGCKLMACIRFERHFKDEVLEVNDVSRGGVCFSTRKYLPPGTKIEIALSYSPGVNNIFVPAEVVRLRQIPDKNLYECGVAYSKPLVATRRAAQPRPQTDSSRPAEEKSRAGEAPLPRFGAEVWVW